MPRPTKRADKSRRNEGDRSQSTSPVAAATALEARLHENALAALQDVNQSIAGGLDPYKLPALGPRRDDVITAVNSPITPILDAATQQALFTRLLVLELSSKNLAGVWPRMRDGKPVPLSEGQENQELLDKVASAVATVNGRVQDILNLLTDQGFVLENVGPENYQTDLPVSPEVEEKVRSIFDLLRSVGPETVKGLPAGRRRVRYWGGGCSDLPGCVGTAERHPQRTSGWGVERP